MDPGCLTLPCTGLHHFPRWDTQPPAPPGALLSLRQGGHGVLTLSRRWGCCSPWDLHSSKPSGPRTGGPGALRRPFMWHSDPQPQVPGVCRRCSLRLDGQALGQEPCGTGTGGPGPGRPGSTVRQLQGAIPSSLLRPKHPGTSTQRPRFRFQLPSHPLTSPPSEFSFCLKGGLRGSVCSLGSTDLGGPQPPQPGPIAEPGGRQSLRGLAPSQLFQEASGRPPTLLPRGFPCQASNMSRHAAGPLPPPLPGSGVTHRAGTPPLAPTAGGYPEHTHLSRLDGSGRRDRPGNKVSPALWGSHAQHHRGSPGRDPGRPRLAGGPGNAAPVGLEPHPEGPRDPEASRGE